MRGTLGKEPVEVEGVVVVPVVLRKCPNTCPSFATSQTLRMLPFVLASTAKDLPAHTSSTPTLPSLPVLQTSRDNR